MLNKVYKAFADALRDPMVAVFDRKDHVEVRWGGRVWKSDGVFHRQLVFNEYRDGFMSPVGRMTVDCGC